MQSNPSRDVRGIAVVDVGYTNTKVLLYTPNLVLLAERKIASPHHNGDHYREIDTAPIIAFAATALRELDRICPVDSIVTTAHGASIVSLRADGSLAVPVMDYMSEPPQRIWNGYEKIMPDYAECFTPPLPLALLHGLQLYWQQEILPDSFGQVRTILPLMQYIAFALGGRPSVEVSSMSCQSHLVDMRNSGPSSVARRLGWDKHYAPPANAWEKIGHLKMDMRGDGFRGLGNVLAGVHDSNANLLRYLAAGKQHFTLLSTGTWIISFDTDANIAELDPSRDIVANKNVFGDTVACSRFFGGKEFELIAAGAKGTSASLACVERLVAREIMALPSFSDSGGPMPGTGLKGRITGQLEETAEARASLASLYCALMMCESLDALHSRGDLIVDGPFSQNEVFLSVLAALRPAQPIWASDARDGTAAGAACLALMPDGMLPKLEIPMKPVQQATLPGLKSYQAVWRRRATEVTAAA